MKVIRILNVITLLGTIVVNGLANALPLNNITTAEISNSFKSLFTPAGYVFAIWGIIYLALCVFAVYQILPSQKDNGRLDRIGLWFILANLFNAAWIFAWHYQQFILTFVLMIGLLVSLLSIYSRLKIGVGKSNQKERWFVDLPFSIYLGWISVATIANISVVLLDLNWGGFGISEPIWTIIVLVVATILGILMTIKRSEVFYTMVLIWAFIGITQNGSGEVAVSIAAWVGSILLVIFLFLQRGFLRRKQLLDRYKR